MSKITTKDGTQIYYKDWGEGQPVASHLIAVAPTLFTLHTSSKSSQTFLAAETLAFVRNLVAWMAGGGRLELALAQPPVFSPEFPSSLALWYELRPRLADRSLKFWKLPRSFDARSWPRALTNPGRTGSVAWFTPTGAVLDFWTNRCLPLCGEHLASLRNRWRRSVTGGRSKKSRL